MDMTKFTQKSLDVLGRAQNTADEHGNSEVSQEHLLLALLTQDGGLIAQLFTAMSVDVHALTAALQRVIERMPKVSGGQVYASGELEAALTAATHRAGQMKDEYISVEHLMLGLFDKASSEIKVLLKEHGVREDAFLKALSTVRGNTRVTSDTPEDTYDSLKKYGTDLVELARNKKLDPVIGRDAEIRNVIRILSRKTKNNPVLIGEPGVGKTAIAEGLALRIVRGDVPESLKDKTIFSLD
ncbi:MAG: Clp protease N-terminal domain-containing protein, partial [Oscillospiraceae bacterium]